MRQLKLTVKCIQSRLATQTENIIISRIPSLNTFLLRGLPKHFFKNDNSGFPLILMVGSGGFLDVSKTKLYGTGSDFKIGFGLKLF